MEELNRWKSLKLKRRKTLARWKDSGLFMYIYNTQHTHTHIWIVPTCLIRSNELYLVYFHFVHLYISVSIRYYDDDPQSTYRNDFYNSIYFDCTRHKTFAQPLYLSQIYIVTKKMNIMNEWTDNWKKNTAFDVNTNVAYILIL